MSATARTEKAAKATKTSGPNEATVGEPAVQPATVSIHDATSGTARNRCCPVST